MSFSTGSLSRNEQIEKLNRLKTAGLLPWMSPALVMITAGLILVGAFSGRLIYYLAAGLAGFAALAARLVIPFRLDAARGLSEGVRQTGTVEIEKKKTTMDAHEFQSFTGLVCLDNRPMWQIDFAQPDGWEPISGVHPAELVFIRGKDWPVALLLEAGILYPSVRPKRLSRF